MMLVLFKVPISVCHSDLAKMGLSVVLLIIWAFLFLLLRKDCLPFVFYTASLLQKLTKGKIRQPWDLRTFLCYLPSNLHQATSVLKS